MGNTKRVVEPPGKDVVALVCEVDSVLSIKVGIKKGRRKVMANNMRIRKQITYLKKNQRVSGQYF